MSPCDDDRPFVSVLGEPLPSLALVTDAASGNLGRGKQVFGWSGETRGRRGDFATLRLGRLGRQEGR